MTEDVRRYRGDWLIEALVAMRRNPHYWQTFTLTPEWVESRNQGRFHRPTNTWWTHAGEDASVDGPKYKHVTLPPETDIGYPGETWYLTPGWQREMEDRIRQEGCWNEFRAYERNMDTIGAAIAYYHPRSKRVVWGPHSHEVRQCVLIVSDATPIEKPQAVKLAGA